MKTAIVTGGAGFVGSHLVEELVKQGAHVIVVDDLSNGRLENLKAVRDTLAFVHSDISRGELVDAVRAKQMQYFEGVGDYSECHPSTKGECPQINEIYHLACYPRQISFKNPSRDLEVNVGSAIKCLEFARLANAKLLFTSNTGIVSKPDKLPVDEQSPPNPLTPYDCHKLTVEHLLRAYSKYYGVKTVTVRFASVYGPRQRVNTELGWHPVIPEFIGKLLIGEAPTIDGDGNQTRDFLNVHDAVQGVIKAMRSDAQEANNGGMFILGTGEETSINMIHARLCKLTETTGPASLVKYGPPKAEDISRMLYDSTKAKKTFGFEPQIKLEDGLQEVVDWMKAST